MNFVTTIGIEYTFQGNNDYLNYDSIEKMAEELITKNKKLFSRAHVDGGALEIPTPVQKNWKQVKHFHKRLIKAVSKMPVVTHREGYGTGGGHIHLGVGHLNESFRKRFVVNILCDVTNRPYLTWIFNEWCDDDTAKCFANDPLSISYLNNRQIPTEGREYAISPRLGGFNSNTIEFRMFDAKRSLVEVEDHLEFALKYYEYILKQTKKGKKILVVNKNKKTMKRYNFKRSVKEFNNLLKELKLDPKRYSKYIDINYKERIKHGVLN